MKNSHAGNNLAIEIVAHRGGIGPCNENTLCAFNHAISTGINFVEMDIRLDHMKRRFYLEHDLLHHPKKKENTLASIVPNLPGETKIMVELKTFAWLTKRFTRRFLQDYDVFFEKEKTIVISFNPFVLHQLRKLRNDISLGFLCGNPFWLFFFRIFYWKVMKPNIFLLHRRLLYQGNVKFGRAHKMKVWSFVLNKRSDWHRAIKLRVDGITTDFPQALRDYLKRY